MKIISAAMLVVSLLACSIAEPRRSPAPGSPGTLMPTSTAAPAPTTSHVTPTQSPAVRPTPDLGPDRTPRVDLTDRERSDRYWSGVTHFGVYGHTYDSLAEITRAAHLVVRGRVVDLRHGEVQPFGDDLPDEIAGAYPEIFGIVAVDEVLKGEPAMRTPGTIEVAGLGWSGISVADLPGDEVILFVMNHARQREERGVPPSADPDDGYHYERPNGYQCVLRNVDGEVGIIEGPRGWKEALGPFPSGLDGRLFDDVVERVRGIAGT